MSKKKIGIYGGTFSPPHIGHVCAAESFSRALPLDELIIMPDFLPPHKQFDGEISAVDRMAMCKLAFGHIDKVRISDLEIKRGGKSYTAVTLEELSGADRELYFLCGTDMFVTLDEWYAIEKIFNLATICYVRREEKSDFDKLIELKKKEYVETYGAKIIKISNGVKEISSSELRDKVRCHSDLTEYLPTKVYKYIIEKGLYI